MQLDMMTMSAVDVTVTTVLGLVLLFTWLRERSARLVGWWGLIMVLQAVGLVVGASGALANTPALITGGLAVMLFSDSLKWTAARAFVNHPTHAAWALAGPLTFLAAANSSLFGGLLYHFMLFSVLTAFVNLGAAFELARAKGERLISHWPAVVALVATAIASLLIIPLSTTVPFETPSEAYLSGWFSSITLVMVIVRIALAFVVLSMAKQRQEMEQRVHALTDTLTGLPNRRALYESIDSLEQKRPLHTGPLSVLFFDLDHFKDVNDTFGHEMGDYALKLFAITATEHLDDRSLIARMGGEEFAAVLPGVSAAGAMEIAEAICEGFAKAGASIDGQAIGTTVSVGVASNTCEPCDASDMGALFRQADAALYVAKRAGRNRVEFAGPYGVTPAPAMEAMTRSDERQRLPMRATRRRRRVAASA